MAEGSLQTGTLVGFAGGTIMYLAQQILRYIHKNTVWLDFMIQCVKNNTIIYSQQSILKYAVETLSLD